MSTITSFRDFDAYKEARIFVKNLYSLTRRKPISPDYALCDQMRRAAIATTSNFAEGYEREGKQEFIQFISYAKGATGETMTQLDIAVDQDYISAEQHREWDQAAEKVRKLLAGLSNYLRKTEHAGLKFKRTVNSKQKTVNLPHRPGRNGFAIISTLLVLTVLTIMVVAFLQSMRIERLTARSYLNKTRADFAAEAATVVAAGKIKKLESTVYAALFEAQGAEASPYLFLARRAGVPGAVVQYERIPLFSSARQDSEFNTLGTSALIISGVTVSDQTSTGSPVIHSLTNASDVTININKASGTQPLGRIGLWQGSTIGSADDLPLPVNWIYLKDDEGAVVGRYAYWVDDETSKINLTTAGNLRGPGNTHLRKDGYNLDEVSLQPLVDLGAPANEVRALIRSRAEYVGPSKIFPDSNLLRYSWFRYFTEAITLLDPVGHAALSPETWKILRGHVTTQSLEDDRTPSGKRKMNLNAVVTNTQDPVRIRLEVEAIRDFILQELPDFGKRYYQNHDSVTAADIKIYATKIAANLRDFIDTDPNATVVLADETILAGAEADPELNGSLPLTGPTAFELPIASGKERGPFLNEYTRLMKVVSGPSSGTGLVTFVPVHYIELYNPTDSVINHADLGSLPFVRICNRAPWSAQPALTFRPPDIKMYLPTTFSIPARGYAVLTTDAAPFYGSQTGFIDNGANRYTLTKGTAAGNWEAVDTGGNSMPTGSLETYSLNLTVHSTDRYFLQTNIRAAGYGTNETRIIFGNSNGLIDMVAKSYEESNIFLGRNVRNPTVHNSNVAGNATSTANNGLAGRFTRADPRTNTEITGIFSDTRSVWIDGLAAYGNNIFQDGRITPGSINHSTNFGTTTANNVLPEGDANSPGSHLVINKPIQSLGDLGGLYDPSRTVAGHRGGGRTLRIGQSDDAANVSRNVTSPSAADRNEQGGRSVDDLASVDYNRNAFLLLDLFRIDDNTGGRVNLSSVGRSPVPLAFMGTQHGFTFSKVVDGGVGALEDKTLKPATGNQSQLILAIKNEQAAGRPIMSPGELSRLRIFSEGTNLVDGVEMKTVEDKGREEWFRRNANLFTTQSLSYSIHVIGQSGRFVGTKFRVEATTARSSKMLLRPQYAEPYNDLVPAAPISWSTSLIPYELP